MKNLPEIVRSLNTLSHLTELNAEIDEVVVAGDQEEQAPTSSNASEVLTVQDVLEDNNSDTSTQPEEGGASVNWEEQFLELEKHDLLEKCKLQIDYDQAKVIAKKMVERLTPQQLIELLLPKNRKGFFFSHLMVPEQHFELVLAAVKPYSFSNSDQQQPGLAKLLIAVKDSLSQAYTLRMQLNQNDSVVILQKLLEQHIQEIEELDQLTAGNYLNYIGREHDLLTLNISEYTKSLRSAFASASQRLPLSQILSSNCRLRHLLERTTINHVFIKALNEALDDKTAQLLCSHESNYVSSTVKTDFMANIANQRRYALQSLSNICQQFLGVGVNETDHSHTLSIPSRANSLHPTVLVSLLRTPADKKDFINKVAAEMLANCIRYSSDKLQDDNRLASEIFRNLISSLSESPNRADSQNAIQTFIYTLASKLILQTQKIRDLSGEQTYAHSLEDEVCLSHVHANELAHFHANPLIYLFIMLRTLIPILRRQGLALNAFEKVDYSLKWQGRAHIKELVTKYNMLKSEISTLESSLFNSSSNRPFALLSRPRGLQFNGDMLNHIENLQDLVGRLKLKLDRLQQASLRSNVRSARL